MSSTVVLTPKFSDAGAFSSGSASVGSAGPANLQNQRANLYYQSTGATPHVIVDLGTEFGTGDSPVPNAIFFGYFNSVASDIFRLRGANSEANLTAAPIYDSNTTHPDGVPMWPGENPLSPVGVALLDDYVYPHRLFRFSAGQSLRWWRVDFTFASYVRGARLVIGPAVVPGLAAAPGWEAGHSEAVIEIEDIGAGQATRPRGARRTLSAEWAPGALTESEHAQLLQILLQRGSGRDLVLCLDDSDELLDPMTVLAVGRVKERIAARNAFVTGRSLAFTVEELGVTQMR